VTVVAFVLALVAPSSASARDCACNDECVNDGGPCSYCDLDGVCANDCDADPEVDGVPCASDEDAGTAPLHKVYRHGGCGCRTAETDAIGWPLGLFALYLGYGRPRRIVIAR